MKTDKPAYWLWYPGDFELYHALKQNFSRVERGYGWPAFWKSDSFRQRVAFRYSADLPEADVIKVRATSGSVGYVEINGKKYPFGDALPVPAGDVDISVHIGCIGAVPSVYVSGRHIRSGEGWLIHDYDVPDVRAAYNSYFTDPDHDPTEWQFSEKRYPPVSEEEINGGVLYSFETELTASLEVIPAKGAPKAPKICLGESRVEALDTECCYVYVIPDENGRCERSALHYAFIPNAKAGDYTVTAVHQYINIPVRASFECDDEELNQIFNTAAHTFMLCSGVFFTDGIKRDKWIWGGDAYQSMLVNRYLTADMEIEQRTLIALRGNTLTTHVNTILDYSLLWILSIEAYYKTYGDMEFVSRMYPKMESLISLCMSQRDENGFIIGREQDWVFIDWADFDLDGALCAEQMLFAEAYRVIARFSPDKKEFYTEERRRLLQKIEELFWDEEQQAYIDSYTSGKRQVTRHANIFAVLFNVADHDRKKAIAKSVLLNEAIPAITTPYFRFYELKALCRLGYLDEVLAEIKRYWGGMLRLGASVFWEEYDPSKPLEQQYEMYGDPYGKSLCHAWSASPIYLFARYFLGIRPESDGANVHTEFFNSLKCSFPKREKQIEIELRDGSLRVREE